MRQGQSFFQTVYVDTLSYILGPVYHGTAYPIPICFTTEKACMILLHNTFISIFEEVNIFYLKPQTSLKTSQFLLNDAMFWTMYFNF